jgi:hypothetical protein
MKFYVTMTDKFMSGWGMAKDKTNKLVIVCDTIEQAELIEKNARKRSEMRFVNLCIKKPSYPQTRYLTTWKSFSDMGGPWIDGIKTKCDGVAA